MTPSWGSIPPAIISTPVNYTAVTLNSAGDAVGNAAILTTEVDWYRFLAPRSGTYIFEATTPQSNMDTVIATYKAGSRLGYNDDIATDNFDSRFSVTLTAGQVHFFGVTNFTGTAGGSYAWKIDGPASSGITDDAFEENDTRSTAYNLGTLTAQQTWTGLKMADSQDWYKFSTTGTGTTSSQVQISFTHTEGDLDLRLYNSSGTEIRRSDGSTNTETVSLNGLAAGTYYAQVYGYNGVFNPDYTLTINPTSGGGTPPSGFQITLRMTGLTAAQQTIFQQAAARWSQVITGDLPSATYNGITVDDVLIDASAVAIDGRGGILGSAGPDRLRSGSYLPYHGTMRFDTADLAALESGGGLLYTVMHEIGHVLGIGTIWSQKGLISGAGGSNPRFLGARATAEYNALFHTTLTSVPVENTGGAGTRDGHWRESVFGNELMTGWLNNGVNPLSRVTAGAMADMGYTVNMNAADSFTPPGGGAGGLGGGSTGGASLRSSEVMKRFGKRDFNPNAEINWGFVDAGQTKGRGLTLSSRPVVPAAPALQSATGQGQNRLDLAVERAKLAQTRGTADTAFASYDRLGGVVAAVA